MDRVPMFLKFDLSKWDRSTIETTLMQKILKTTKAPRETTLDLYEHLMRGSIDCRRNLDIRNKEFLAQAKGLYEKADKLKATALLNQVITTSTDKSLLMDALKFRAGIHKELHQHERAIMDYELFLMLSPDKHYFSAQKELCGIIDSFIMLGNFRDAITYFRTLENVVNMQKEKMEKSSLSEIAEIQQEMLIRELRVSEFREKLARNIHFSVPIPSIQGRYADMPYQGFTERYSKSIPYASIACSYRPAKGNSPARVLANRAIPKNTPIVVETPVSGEIRSVMTHCDYCYAALNRFFYTCFDCHIRVYCSSHCMRDDFLHSFECSAYKSLLVTLMDVKHVYRLFIKSLIYMQRTIFKDPKYRQIDNAEELLINIRQDLANPELPNTMMGILLNTNYDYNILPEEEYCSMIIVAFRIAMCLPLLDLLLMLDIRFDLCQDELAILLAALLLQLQMQVFLTSSECGIASKESEIDNRPNVIKERMREVLRIGDTNDSFKQYQITNQEVDNSAETIITAIKSRQKKAELKRETFDYPTKEHKELTDAVLLKTYLVLFPHRRYLGPPTLRNIGQKLTMLSWGETLKLMYDMAQEYLRALVILPEKSYTSYSYLCTMSTLPKFRHSCDPNVQVILLANGQLVAKTLKQINYGDELFVAMGPHYLYSTTRSRNLFLRLNNIVCKCEHCTRNNGEQYIDMRSIKCPECGAINDIYNSCPNCNADIHEYQNELDAFELQLNLVISRMQNDANCSEYHAEKEIMQTLLVGKKFIERVYPVGTSLPWIMLIVRAFAHKNFIPEALKQVDWCGHIIDKAQPAMSHRGLDAYWDILKSLMLIFNVNVTCEERLFANAIWLQKVYFKAVNIIEYIMSGYEFWEFQDQSYIKACEYLNFLKRCRNTVFTADLRATDYFKALKKSCEEQDTVYVSALPELIDSEEMKLPALVKTPSLFTLETINESENGATRELSERELLQSGDDSETDTVSEEESQIPAGGLIVAQATVHSLPKSGREYEISQYQSTSN